MKRITLITALLTIGLTSWGQTRMQLSFNACPSVNWMSTDNKVADKQKLTLGYDFGLSGDIFFTENERYALLTGLQILNSGGAIAYRTADPFEFSGATLPPSTQIRYRLRYAEVPLAIKLKTDQFHRVSYWGQFGFSAMLNIGAKGDSEDGQLKRASIHDEINLFNLAMNVGAGFDFDLGGNNSVTVGLVFLNGLSDVTTNNTFTDKTILNSLKIKLGMIF